jgi:hypothetical protein
MSADYQERCPHCGVVYWHSQGHACPVIQYQNAQAAANRQAMARDFKDALTPKCPRCQSARLFKKKGASMASFGCCSCCLAPMLLPFLFFLPKAKTVCLDCNFEW